MPYFRIRCTDTDVREFIVRAEARTDAIGMLTDKNNAEFVRPVRHDTSTNMETAETEEEDWYQHGPLNLLGNKKSKKKDK